MVDTYPVHVYLPESCYGTCGRFQPSLTRGVWLQACSYVLPSGPAATRRFSTLAKAMTSCMAAEVVALMQSDERASLDAVCKRLVAKARDADLHGVASDFEKMRMRKAPRAGWVDMLFSALCGVLTRKCCLRSHPRCRVQEAVRDSRSGRNSAGPSPLGLSGSQVGSLRKIAVFRGQMFRGRLRFVSAWQPTTFDKSC